MWKHIKNWPLIQNRIKYFRQQWWWLALYAIACLLVLRYPGLAVLLGFMLLSAELFHWLHTIGKEVNLAGILQSTVVLTMWVAPAVAWWGAGKYWYTGHIMPVSERIYWSLAAPGTAVLNLTLRWPRAAVSGSDKWRLQPDAAAFILIFLGLIGQWATGWMPPVLRLVAHLGAQLVFVGILYGILAWPARRWWWVLGGSLYAGAIALQTTLFGVALLWSLMMILTAVKDRTISPGWRYGLAGGSILAVLVLLSFKYEYRKIIQQGKRDTPPLQLFAGMLWDQISHPQRWVQSATVETVVNRFNQGYYTAQAMAWTPAREPYARGETLLKDIRATLLPRLLDPDKHRAGGFDNMQRFAGVSGRTYSMNIGVFGEAYVNFGIAGGVFCLLGYAALLCGVFTLANRHLDLPWWPLLFLPALHVESDIGIVWNHIAKAGIMAIGLIVLIRFLLKHRKT